MTDMNSSYAADGYLLAKGMFPRDEIAAFVRQIHDIFDRSARERGIAVKRGEDGRVSDAVLFELFDRHRPTYVACMRAIQNLPLMFALGCSNRILETVRQLGIAQPVLSSRPIVTLSSRRTSQHIGHWKTPAHQDWRSIQGSLNGVVAWSPLFDVTPALGRLEVVPGSHRLGLMEAESDDWYMHVAESRARELTFVPVDTQAGDMLFFSMFLVHRSGTNTLDTHRYAVQYRYNDAAEPSYVTRDYPTTYRSDPPVTNLLTSLGSADDLAKVFGPSAK